jgi:protein-S-isoprenylcysteine O-methyltransferase Ste14
METMNKTKKHKGRADLLGEHVIGDTGQLILFGIFMVIWIGDSFIWKYSANLSSAVPLFPKIIISGVILHYALYLAITGLKQVFGTVREKPTIIKEGVFSLVRHPVYVSAILLYLGLTVMTMSLLSAGFLLIIISFYYYICRYEEKILTHYFGLEYVQYKKEVGMLLPK